MDIILAGLFLFFLILFSSLTYQKELREREKNDPEYKEAIDKLNSKK